MQFPYVPWFAPKSSLRAIRSLLLLRRLTVSFRVATVRYTIQMPRSPPRNDFLLGSVRSSSSCASASSPALTYCSRAFFNFLDRCIMKYALSRPTVSDRVNSSAFLNALTSTSLKNRTSTGLDSRSCDSCAARICSSNCSRACICCASNICSACCTVTSH